MSTSDWFFCDDINNNCFYFVPKDFWEKNKHLDDSFDEIDCLPDRFFSITDSTFEYDGDIEEGKQKLLDAGFIFSDELNDFVSKPFDNE